MVTLWGRWRWRMCLTGCQWLGATLLVMVMMVPVQAVPAPLEENEEILVEEMSGDAIEPGVSQFPSTQVSLEVFPADNPRVLADGRSLVSVSGRVVDGQGTPIAQDVLITLTTEAGKFVGADYDVDQPGFQILARFGEFTAELQSSLDAGPVRVRAGVNRHLNGIDANPDWFYPETDLQAYTQVEFVTHLRPALTTGSISVRLGAAGTDYYGSFRDFLDPDASGADFDVDAALFTTGQVGEWLVTGAVNSDRNLNETCDGRNDILSNDQLCDNRYGVYGDSSTVESLTPSTDSFYLRFQRDAGIPNAEPDYAMWGDFDTQELSRPSQLFSGTNQQLHGFKANYNWDNLQITALYSNSVDGFARDPIVPDGTSGYYFLSNRLVIGGSETVFIETEELSRPGLVIERRPMYRGSDYEIDYDRGTLLFRRPIQATEYDLFGNTLVRRIVATYQFESDGDNTNLYGGRLQYHFSRDLNQESWLGANILRSDQGDQDFTLYGADANIALGERGRLVAEVAASQQDSPLLGDISGTAYRVEANGAVGDWLNASAFFRSVSENFSNTATTSFTPGQTRYGTQLAARVGDTTQLTFNYDHEDNFGTAAAPRVNFFDLFDPQPQPTPGSSVDNSLTTLRAGILQQIGQAEASLEYVNRNRDDDISNTFDTNTSQLVSRLNIPITESLAFLAQNELNLGGSDPIYPNRTTLGLNWEAFPGVSFRVAHQFADGGLSGSDSITSFDTLLDHNLTEDLTVNGRYSLLGGTNGTIGQGAVGLNYRWAIAPGLRMNLGYERIFGDVLSGTAAGTQFAQPYAVGQSAASLGLVSGDSYSVGLEYTDNPDFQASARVEHRTSDNGDNTVISASASGKLTPSLTTLFRYQQANAANQLLTGLGDTVNLKLGLAYRDPNFDNLNALLRYEYRRNPSVIPDTLLLGSGTGSDDHLLSLEAIYAPDWRWELYGKYAMRSSRSYLADSFSNSSTLHLAQLRASHQFHYRWDIALEGRVIWQPSAGYTETGAALELGYYPSPDFRISAGYSFGSAHDRDLGNRRSSGGPYLGAALKINELINGFGRQQVVPDQQTESSSLSSGAELVPAPVVDISAGPNPTP